MLKHPELPYFVVPHPIVSMDEDALNASADAIFEAISAAIARNSATPNRLGTRSEG